MALGTRIARGLRIGGAALLLALMVLGPGARPGAAEDSRVLEHRVKAAFLYKFASYVEWPAGSFPRPDSPLRIGVIGDDDLAAELTRTVAGRTVDTRSVTVLSSREADFESVHMVFIGRSQAGRLAALVRSLQQRPILIVTETDNALSQGAMINFLLAEGRVRFEISLAAAGRSGLQLSSRLLAVAQNVVTRTP